LELPSSLTTAAVTTRLRAAILKRSIAAACCGGSWYANTTPDGSLWPAGISTSRLQTDYIGAECATKKLHNPAATCSLPQLLYKN
jgi:hypothetical protein